MKKILTALACLSVFAWYAIPAVAADGAALPTCKDGTTSTVAGKGACSHHGGVQKGGAAAATSTAATTTKPERSRAAKAKPKSSTSTAAKATTSSTRAAGSTDSGPATAKCKDGTMSHAAHHQGACSKHGGVAEFLDNK